MTVITRFAPSPTGYLHIGGARTAMFNWLFARHHGGEFLLRIEDTDKERNVAEAIQPIIDGLAWLGIQSDRDITFQSQRSDRHREVADALLASGAAYRCYMTPEEGDAAKAETRRTGRVQRSPWRDLDAEPATDEPFTVRLRMPAGGQTTIVDLVQGPVTVENDTLDDMIILRADGSPTYMLAVVVDDHDAGITHVIRGDDHLTNAFRQLALIRAMGWAEPAYAHIPLILDEKGKKLSKRHGAAGVEFYRDSGFVPDAVFNYLLRMGWGHGDHELFSRDKAIRLFDLDGVGKAPARLDQKRLEYLNGVYLRDSSDADFLMALMRYYDAVRSEGTVDLNFAASMVPIIKERSRTLVEAASYIAMAANRPNDVVLTDDQKAIVRDFVSRAADYHIASDLKAVADQMAEDRGIKLKVIAAALRLALMGSTVSPPLFETMALLDGLECRARFSAATD